MGKVGQYKNLHNFLEAIVSESYEDEEEGIVSSELDVSDIYNFYLAALLYQNIEEGDKEAIRDTLLRIKSIYIDAFKVVVKEQLKKYLSRQRTDGSFTLIDVSTAKSFSSLDEFMNRTYRSDMKRKNDVWNEVTKYLSLIEKENKSDKLIYLIDRLNNCIHNTQESILTKFDNGYELVEAFDTAHTASVRELRGLATDNRLKKMLVRYRYLLDENIKNPDDYASRRTAEADWLGSHDKPKPRGVYKYWKKAPPNKAGRVTIVESEIGSKTLAVFDFDDTLASSNNLVYVVRDGEVVKELDSGDYATYEPEPGDQFDFSDFANVTDAETLDAQFNIFQRYIKDPNIEVAILTARADDAKPSIIRFLRDQGVSTSEIHIECVGSSNPVAKLNWIKKEYYTDEYNKIEFYDDSNKNISIVKNWLDRIGIKYKLVHVSEMNNKVFTNRGKLAPNVD